MKLLQILRKNKTNVNKKILLDYKDITLYYELLRRFNKVKLNDKHSSYLKTINPIKFFSNDIITDINNMLSNDNKYLFGQELIDTVKFYTITTLKSYRLIDIIKYHIDIEFSYLRKIYGKKSNLILDSNLDFYLNQEYLITLYKIIKYKLYLTEKRSTNERTN